jgi:hypothetical protein
MKTRYELKTERIEVLRSAAFSASEAFKPVWLQKIRELTQEAEAMKTAEAGQLVKK